MGDELSEGQNRRARRAAAKTSGKPVAAPTTAPRLKLAQPDYGKPTSKTLLDLYNEKQPLLSQGQPFDVRHADGKARDEQGNVLYRQDDAVIGPVADAFFWSSGLAMLHFTLDVLAQNQYRQDIAWASVAFRTATMMPILWLLLYMLRSQSARRWPLARQALFFAIAVGCGSYTIRVANKFSYYAVMKQAPPLGTLWIWSVIEMDLPYAVASLIVDGAYLWLNGFSIY